MTTINTTVHIPEDILFQELAGEAVLLNIKTGKYYGLDDVGTRMWMLIQEHGRLEPVLSALLSEYEVEEQQLQTDLFKLVDDLVTHGLLAVDDQ